LLRGLVLGALLVVITGAAPALARTDIGTCLTAGGVRVAPWTDGRDPACGEDCGADGQDDDDDATVATCVDGGCEGASAWRLPPPTPDPTPGGPRCLTGGPSCEPGAPAPTSDGWMAPVAPVVHAIVALPPRAPGTLPGAAPVAYRARLLERVSAPPTPPPRSRSFHA
jgi:hypothetical protein